ncbi:MAG: GTPase Era [Lentisphaerae bacterium]|nr:GTPase Era [Lentisphaerota bacterium]
MPASQPATTAAAQRAAMVAIVGRANVGKSTLINALLGEKVSNVSQVPQTTRNYIRGVWTETRGQLVLLDTPGVHRASHDLGRLMNKAARTAAAGADIVLLLLDASERPQIYDQGWMQRLGAVEQPLVIALNKIDALNPRCDQRATHRHLWQRSAGAAAAKAHWIEISAKTGQQLSELRNLLFDLAPCGPLLFPAGMLSDFPRKLLIADIVREKLWQVLKDELPHACAIQIIDLTESASGWAIRGTILVNKPSQKGIVIGRRGRQLTQVIRAAERELMEIYDQRISLRLQVRVQAHWAKNTRLLRQLGYTP